MGRMVTAAGREPAGLAARAAALDLLAEVLGRRRPLDEALHAHAGLAGLEARDRGFARLLVATTLRRLGEIDSAIAARLERPLPVKAGAVRDVLRLGIAQIRFLEVSPHAAVDTAVSLVRKRARGNFAGLVNAVLRGIVREGAPALDRDLAARLDTPDWLWERWAARWGETGAAAITAAHLDEPPLDVTAREDPDGWAERLGATLLSTGSLRLDSAGPVTALPGYEAGAWWVQDAAAALPARLLGDVAGRRVADLCAAPGGKTAQLAAAGARVVAVERSATRIGRLRENLARLGLDAEIVEADAAEWRPDAAFDAVLLDAPCIATGTIRRHPDIAHLKRAEDVAATVPAQARLLDAALGMVAPGGLVVYAVCSLEPEEGEAQVARILASRPDVVRVTVAAAEIGGLAEAVSPDGDLRTLPSHLAGLGGMDGFYAARLRRSG